MDLQEARCLILQKELLIPENMSDDMKFNNTLDPVEEERISTPEQKAGAAEAAFTLVTMASKNIDLKKLDIPL